MTKTIFHIKLWLGVITINNSKHLKRVKQRIDACSMESNKMVGLLCARKQKKKKILSKFIKLLLVLVSSIQFGDIERFSS